MEDEFLRDLIHRLPLGYARYKKCGNGPDGRGGCTLLDKNEAFDRIFASGEEPGDGRPDWTDLSRASERELAQGYSQTLQIRGRWYKTLTYAPEKDHFVTVFQDVTAEIGNLRLLQRRKEELERLSGELETIFNGTQDALFFVEVKDGRFRYLRVNDAYRKSTGLCPADIEGREPAALLGEELGETVCGHYRECVSRGEAVTYEQELRFPAGSRIWLISLTPFFDNGRVTHLVGSGKDVTELRELRGDKLELLQRQHSMFREHSAAMLLIHPESGRILDANPAACGFYGYAREELLGLAIGQLDVRPHGETQRDFRAAAHGGGGSFITRHRLKNGETRIVEVYACPVSHAGRPVLFSILFDVTDRERYRESLCFEKELLRTTLDSIGDGVVTTDRRGNVTSVNQAAQEIAGWSDGEAKGRPFREIFRLRSEVTGKTAADPVARVLRSGKIVGLANHTVLIGRQGRPVPVADSAAPIRDKDGGTHGVVMVFRDVSHEKERKKQILFLSYHDPLTGLYNRRFLEEEMLRLERERQFPFSLIMGDVNGLKITNDVFGHKAGDRLLREVARALTDSCGREDVISRWGGDEFLILLPGKTAAQAEETIRKIKGNLAARGREVIKLSVAFGCAEKNAANGLQQTVQTAEEWMYHQKLLEGKSYRNTVISTLLCTLYEKSLETEKHDERLKKYCRAVGGELGLAAEELDDLSLLALLHDVGKVGVSQSVLQKPGPLTPGEWKEMKKHPEIGYRIAQNIPELSDVSEYILSHHERWDGGGYPHGLAGEEIPLYCRILAVADAYDAMTNDRVYRKALGKEAAIGELQKNSGTQFDPRIVEIFIRLVTGGESECAAAGPADGSAAK